jgi:prepilin-type processing-associated H-X9-DG protein
MSNLQLHSRTAHSSWAGLGNRGFALRDLLAIVCMATMLGTFGAVWLGTLGREREAILCLTNGRQMMRAFALYAQDYDGLLAGNEDDSAAPPGHNWFRGDVRGLSNLTNQFAAGDPGINVLAPYANDSRIWKCPADPTTVRVGGVQMPTVRSVSMNGAVGTVCNTFPGFHNGTQRLATHGPWLDGNHGHTRGSKFRTFGRDGDFVLPAETFVFIDEHPPSINDGHFGHPAYTPLNPELSVVRWVDYPALYHGQAGGITYADGHAEMRRWRALRFPSTGIPAAAVTAAQRADWEWLALRATQTLRSGD